jgi:hypothetical protein
VHSICGINNHLYLHRIANIAKGNPRLAIMAGKLARSENTLDSISDVSVLYDEYFISIRKDIDNLGDISVVGVAGLIAFFRSVDRTNKEVMKGIETTFGISSETFWDYALKLHEMEIVDLWENEVVRFSDQVLSTYLFYLCFFKQHALSFAKLLRIYFPNHKDRLYDSFYPMVNAFYSENLIKLVRKEVDVFWENYVTANNIDLMLYISEVFWFVKETDILLLLKNLIDNLDYEPIRFTNQDIKPDSNIYSPSILSVLRKFAHSSKENLNIALSLIIDYVEKRPSDLPKVYYILTEEFGFHYNSYLNDYYVQRKVVETLWERIQGKDNNIIILLFLVSKSYLQTRFHTAEPSDRHSINFIEYNIPHSQALFELRSSIWKKLFTLFASKKHRRHVIDTLAYYAKLGPALTVYEIIEYDSTHIIPFIDSSLNPTEYLDCKLIHDLLDLFDEHKVNYDHKLRSKIYK